jgi:tetratricopeptide repeat protein 19
MLFVQAENLFLEVLKRLLVGGEETKKESNAVVEISLKLASIYQARGDVDKARQGFDFCTKTQERKIQRQGENT